MFEAIPESCMRQDEQRKDFMTIWQQANLLIPKKALDEAAEYEYKFYYMVNKPKAVDVQAREMTGRLSTVTAKAHKSEVDMAESLVESKISRGAQAEVQVSRLLQRDGSVV